MSDGATNPTPTQVQCANCSAEDSIVIAGKTFCANCGTPQDPNAAAAIAASSALAATTPTSGAAPAGPAAEKMPLDIDSTPVKSASSSFSASPAATLPAATASPLDTVDTSAATTAGPGDLIAPSEPSTTQDSVSAPSSEQLHDSVQTAADSGIQKYSSRPASYDSVTNTAEASEIDSLSDGKEETVMSDSALAELSQANDLPVPTELTTTATPASPPPPVESSYKLDLTKPAGDNLPKAMSDIRPATAAMPTSPTPNGSSNSAPVAPPAGSVTQPNVAVVAPAVATPPLAAPSTAPAAAPAAPVPITPVAPTPSVAPAQPSAAPVQPAVASIAQQDANMAAAVSPASPKTGLKASSIALSLVGLLLVGAYIWQVNYPNLALKVAGSKAGISANFPGYVPNGWKLSGNIISSPGNISYNLAGQKDGQNIAVKESKTDWDSQALAENYVAPKATDYLALQAQGLTIYLYNDNQASWVNNGNWYRLEGSSKGLSQDQIIKIATSL